MDINQVSINIYNYFYENKNIQRDEVVFNSDIHIRGLRGYKYFLEEEDDNEVINGPITYGILVDIIEQQMSSDWKHYQQTLFVELEILSKNPLIINFIMERYDYE
jgi:hypothetical protein